MQCCIYFYFLLLKGNLGELLNCPICFEIYRDPKVLPCHHSFCKECLVRCIDNRNSVKCPMCSMVHRVPSSGFPADFRSNTISDLYNDNEVLMAYRINKSINKNKQDKQVIVIQRSNTQNLASTNARIDDFVHRFHRLESGISSTPGFTIESQPLLPNVCVNKQQC